MNSAFHVSGIGAVFIGRIERRHLYMGYFMLLLLFLRSLHFPWNLPSSSSEQLISLSKLDFRNLIICKNWFLKSRIKIQGSSRDWQVTFDLYCTSSAPILITVLSIHLNNLIITIIINVIIIIMINNNNKSSHCTTN